MTRTRVPRSAGTGAGGRPDDLRLRAAAVEWVLTDVDGVLTDGRLHYGPEGESWKSFHVRDGLGFKLAQSAGLKVGVLSARGNAALERRAAELELDAVVVRREDKREAFAEFLAAHGADARRVAYAGDDLVDLPVLLRCGLSFAPADAAPEVRDRVDHVLATRGGQGAVREMVEWLLRTRGDWDRRFEEYLR